MSDPTIDAIRRDRAALETEIRAAGSTFKGNAHTCANPAHDDAHPSAGVYRGEDGVWRDKCHGCGWCGDIFDLRALLTGRDVGDVLREARGESRQSGPAAPTAPDMATLAKRYYAAISGEQRQALADELGLSVDSLRRLRVGWCERDRAFSFPMRDMANGITGIRLRSAADGSKFAERGGHDGLFIPTDLAGKGVLIVAEGATDTPAATDAGIDAIGRSNNSSRACEDLIVQYVTLNPRDEVWIVTDADAAGSAAAKATREAADRLAARLVPLVGTVKVFSPPAPHKDLRAWRNAGATSDDIEAVADATPSRGPAGELHAMLAAEIDGTRRAIPMPWKLATRGTQALIPGTITLPVGDPGSGKTLFELELFQHLHDAGVPVAMFMLEGERAFHLKRALAQRVGASWLTDLEAVAAKPTEAMAYHAEHAAWIDSFGRCIFDAPGKPVTLADLTKWIEARAAGGVRVVAIDPITAAETSDRPWDDARQFMQGARAIIERYGVSLVLVTHPAKSKGRATMRTLDDLAGGSAWARFADCVLWLERHDEPREVNVRDPFGAFPLSSAETVTRTLRVMKARHGRGAGWQLAFDFDPATLRFSERGLIVKPSRAEVAE